MNTIKMPISFDSNYSMKTVVEGNDEYYALLLADALRIEPEELPISTTFGVLDPTFGFQTPLKAVQNAARHIPEILIEDVSSTIDDDGQIKLGIKFTVRGN